MEKLRKIKHVGDSLDKLSAYLRQVLPILNTHMVHFITGNEWTKLDLDLQSDLMSLSYEQLAMLPDDFLNLEAKPLHHIGPALRRLMEDIHKHSLSTLNVLDDLNGVWTQLKVEPATSAFHFDKFMKLKKTHEVAALCDVVASLARFSESDLILDLGCGKGALGSLISLNHDIFVCGIDAVGFDSHVESDRQSNLEKAFNAQLKKSLQIDETSDDQAIKKSLRFRRTTQFLSADFNCQLVIDECQNYFQRSFENRLGIVGLHTCGNLASTSIELFVNSPGTRFLCNVGCCYHLLEEAYEKETSTHPGFPISSNLKAKQFTLGRNARMVAAQPLERYASQKKLQPDVLFYRALLQVILKDKLKFVNPREFQVGRLRKPVGSFVQYARWALGKLQFDFDIADEELLEYFKSYHSQSIKLHAFFQLRLLLAPLVETIVLLDRLAFLLEHEKVSDAFLVKIFSPVTSPRCYALMAFKS